MTLFCSDFLDEDGCVLRDTMLTRVRAFPATAEPVPWYEVVSVEHRRRYILVEGPLEMLRDFTFQTPVALQPNELISVRAGEAVESLVRFVFEGLSLDKSTGEISAEHQAMLENMLYQLPNTPAPVRQDPPASLERVHRRIRLK